MVQILAPVADTAIGSWTTDPLWSKVDDDSTVSPSGDGTVIQSDAVTTAGTAETTDADLDLASGSDPSSSTGHIIRARWRATQGTDSISGKAELWQGTPGTGTLIAALTQTLSNTEVEGSYTLTGTEADSITDYGILQIRLHGTALTGGPGRRLEVDLVELELPDAGAGAQTIIPTGVASAESFGSPTVSSEAFIAPASIPSAEAFGSHTLTATATITPSSIASSEAFGTASLSLTITSSSIPSAESFGSPTITSTATIQAIGIPSGESFGSPSVSPVIQASSIPSAESFGTPSLSQVQSIQATGIPSGESFGSHTLTSVAFISPSPISSAESFGFHTLVTTSPQTITAESVPSTESFGIPVFPPHIQPRFDNRPVPQRGPRLSRITTGR